MDDPPIDKTRPTYTVQDANKGRVYVAAVLNWVQIQGAQLGETIVEVATIIDKSQFLTNLAGYVGTVVLPSEALNGADSRETMLALASVAATVTAAPLLTASAYDAMELRDSIRKGTGDFKDVDTAALFNDDVRALCKVLGRYSTDTDQKKIFFKQVPFHEIELMRLMRVVMRGSATLLEPTCAVVENLRKFITFCMSRSCDDARLGMYNALETEPVAVHAAIACRDHMEKMDKAMDGMRGAVKKSQEAAKNALARAMAAEQIAVAADEKHQKKKKGDVVVPKAMARELERVEAKVCTMIREEMMQFKHADTIIKDTVTGLVADLKKDLVANIKKDLIADLKKDLYEELKREQHAHHHLVRDIRRDMRAQDTKMDSLVRKLGSYEATTASLVDGMIAQEDQMKRVGAFASQLTVELGDVKAWATRNMETVENVTTELSKKVDWLVSCVNTAVCSQYNSALAQWHTMCVNPPVACPVLARSHGELQYPRSESRHTFTDSNF